jgi:hypothetical protein
VLLNTTTLLSFVIELIVSLRLYSTFISGVFDIKNGFDIFTLEIDDIVDVINIIIFVLFVVCCFLIINTYKEHIGCRKTTLGFLIITLYKLLETAILFFSENKIMYHLSNEEYIHNGFNYAVLVAPMLSAIALLIFLVIYIKLKNYKKIECLLSRFTAIDAIILYIGSTSYVFNYYKFVFLLIILNGGVF